MQWISDLFTGNKLQPAPVKFSDHFLMHDKSAKYLNWIQEESDSNFSDLVPERNHLMSALLQQCIV